MLAFPRPRRRHLAPAGLTGLLLLTLGGGAVAKGGASQPGNPGTGLPVIPDPGAGPIVFDDDATPTVPIPGAIVDPQPTGWDHVTIWPDGRTVTVFFWNGVEACYGLDRIEVADVDGTPRITLFTGFRKDAAAIRCVEMAQLYSTVVILPSPVLGGGLPGLEGVQPGSGDAETMLPGAYLVDPRQQPWDLVQVGPDGHSLWAWFTGGATPCFGLGGVDLVEVDGLPTLTLTTGSTDTLAMCIAIIVGYRTPVAVPDAIVLGGLV